MPGRFQNCAPRVLPLRTCASLLRDAGYRRPLVQREANFRKPTCAMGTILLILLILLLIGALPTWPYSSGWGYYPTGGLGLLVVIILVLVLLGRI
jgi:Protein of unknown function (DUF3309)